MLEFKLSGIEFRQVQDVVQQFHQYFAGVVGNRQLLALLGIQWTVQRQRDHSQQAVERCADFMAHVGEKIRACLSHVQRCLSRDFQFPIG
ncbi:hypothetical protein D3C71_1435390 [compost metagenome]